jgi:hypothetical protein
VSLTIIIGRKLRAMSAIKSHISLIKPKNMDDKIKAIKSHGSQLVEV